MAYKYFPHTEKDIATMLERIGISSLKELYADVPDSILFKGEYNLGEAKSETEIRNYFKQLCDKNKLLTVLQEQVHTTTTHRLSYPISSAALNI